MKSFLSIEETKRIVLELDDKEWSTYKHTIKVHGPIFVKEHLEDFFERRHEQRRSDRRHKLLNAFEKADTKLKSDIIKKLGVDFDDE